MSVLPAGSKLFATLSDGQSIYLAPVMSSYDFYGTDGTPSGAQALFSFGEGQLAGSTVNLIDTLGSTALILGASGSTYDLYRTDGTTAGTALLIDLSPSSEFQRMTTVNGRDIFLVQDGLTYSVYGTDGTADGTQKLFQTTFDDGSNSGVELLSTSGGTATFASWRGSSDSIYTTDGTATGTTLTRTGTVSAGSGSPDFAFGVILQELFGGPQPPGIWTGVANDWVGPQWTFIDHDSHGNVDVDVPIYPNWSDLLLPGPNDDVTVDISSVLNADVSQEINGLSVASAAVLDVTGQITVQASVADHGAIFVSGGLAVSGTITVDSSALFVVDGGRLTGGTLNSASGVSVPAGSSGTLTAVTIAPGTTFTGEDNSSTSLAGTIVNDGTLALAPTSHGASFVAAATTELTGSGVVSLGGTLAALLGQFATTIDSGQTIVGSGAVYQLVNLGTIIGEQTAALSVIDVTNDGSLLATNGGTLIVNRGTNHGIVEASGGTVIVTGIVSQSAAGQFEALAGATVLLHAGGVTGGTLAVAAGGVIETAAGSSGTLTAVTIAPGTTFTGEDNSSTSLAGTIVNDGTLALAPTSHGASFVAAATTELTGSGVVSLGGTLAALLGQFATTIDSGQTIVGSGAVYQLVNLGTIIGEQTAALSVIDVTNDGSLLATNGGTLIVNRGTNHGIVEASGGTVIVTGIVSQSAAGQFEALAGATILLHAGGVTGGTLAVAAGGVIETAAGSSGTLTAVTIAPGTTFTGEDNSSTSLAGTIVNDGTLALAPTSHGASFVAAATTELTGSGVVSLGGTLAALLGQFATTIDSGQTIIGSGAVYQLVNLGTIIGEQTAALTVIDVTNDGTLLATNGGTLIVNRGTNHGIVEASGGTVIASSLIVSGGASNLSGSGPVEVTGPNSLLTNTGSFLVGDTGLGRLDIDTGGSATTTAGLVIANTSLASGSSATISGTGSELHVPGTLVIGSAGFGSLSLFQGATIIAGVLDLAASAGGDGVVSVVGAGTTLNVIGSLIVGDQGAGDLSILGGAHMSIGGGAVGGAGAHAAGNVDIEGAGSQFTINTGSLVVGANGPAEFTLGIGATLQGQLSTAQFGVTNLYGTVDPATDPNDGTQNVGFNNSLIYDFYVANSGTIKVISGAATYYTPLVTDETNAQDGSTNGLWVIGAKDTLVMNATSVDNTQTFDFTSASAASLVIGQVPQSDPNTLDTFNGQTTPTLTGGIAPGAANVLSGWRAPLENYQAGDVIRLQGLTYGSATVTGDVVTVWSGTNGQGTTLGSLVFIDKSDSTTSAAALAEAAAAQTQINALACFAAGTRIATPGGWVEVEDLQVGDMVLTADGESEPAIWVGSRGLDCTRHPRPETVWPIRIASDAFGENVPVRDLYLSPDHAVLVNGVLVPVRLLVNGTTIAPRKRYRITYHHVELPRHAVILAEGLQVESYLPIGDRANFRDGGMIRPSRGAVAPAMLWETTAAAPLVLAGAALEVARRAIAHTHADA